jgi:hypothetical protein
VIGFRAGHPTVNSQAAHSILAGSILGLVGPGPNSSEFRRNGLEGGRTTPAIEVRSKGGSLGRRARHGLPADMELPAHPQFLY